MSYNVSRSYYLNGELSIEYDTAMDLMTKFKHGLAECNLLEHLEVDTLDKNINTLLTIENPYWYGEFSGRCIDNFKEILSHTKGNADLCLVWEGGDCITGLRVEDGKVTECDVVLSLEPKQY